MDINTQRTHADYTIGWICALPVELAASQVMLDATHAPLPQRESDHNVYTLGEAHGHNVVIAGLPAGIYGISSSAIVASQLLMTFPSIRFSLMVGIGGGVPGPKNPDIRLGDVVVSKPTGTFGGVVQYDYGKTIIDQRFHRTGALNKPPSTLLAAVTKLQADHMIGSSRIPDCLWELRRRYSPHGTMFVYPGSRYDVLFEAEREHVEPDPNGECTRCDNETQVFRIQRISTAPRIHYGLIASGNQVMRNGLMRDSISRELNGEVLCFEMEAAGLMDNFNCLVIRGICDYADSHKNKLWQPYAAAVAAAYAKELLSVIPLVQAEETLVGNEQLTLSARRIFPDTVDEVARVLKGINLSPSSSDYEKPLKMAEVIHRGENHDIISSIDGLVCADCTILAPSQSFNQVMWICCHCGDGPKYFGFQNVCTFCDHCVFAI